MRQIGLSSLAGVSSGPWPIVLATVCLFAAALVWIQTHPVAPKVEAPVDGEPVARATALPGAYAADVLRVVDGDTVEMQVHVWLGQDIRTSVRLRGIDAPELHARCDAERRGAERAQERLRVLLAAGPVLVSNPSPDKYFGRVLAELRLSDGRDVGRVLLAEGLARPYQGGTRQSWCEQG